MKEQTSIVNRHESETQKVLPQIPSKQGTLIFGLMVQYLKDRLVNYLCEGHLEFKLVAESVHVSLNNLEDFIVNIIDDAKLFNEIEMETVTVLFLEENETLDFETFTKTQNFSKLYKLIKAKDLIYILNNKTLQTYFQPIIDVKKNEIYAYECLSRGIKQNGSVMSSQHIFRKASRLNDLLYYLDREARESALTNAFANQIKSKLFINFIPTSIYKPETSLRDTFIWTEKLGIDPHNIVFEIIETEDIVDKEQLKSFLDTYRKYGFEIAIDDIGNGYSSLSLLSHIRPEYIKVNMELIRDIDKNPFNQSIFVALSYISKENGIKLLAEGVETKEELDFCISKDVDLIQGFYFSKPTLIPIKSINSLK